MNKKKCTKCNRLLNKNNFSNYWSKKQKKFYKKSKCKECSKKLLNIWRNSSETSKKWNLKYRIQNKDYYYKKKKEWEKKMIAKDPEYEVGEHIKDGARQRNLSHPHSANEYRDWFKSIKNKVCTYCGCDNEQVNKFLKKKKINKKFNRLSVDRIDSKIGYKLNNIVIACYVCNLSKSSIINHSDFKVIAKKYIRPKIIQSN